MTYSPRLALAIRGILSVQNGTRKTSDGRTTARPCRYDFRNMDSARIEAPPYGAPYSTPGGAFGFGPSSRSPGPGCHQKALLQRRRGLLHAQPLAPAGQKWKQFGIPLRRFQQQRLIRCRLTQNQASAATRWRSAIRWREVTASRSAARQMTLFSSSLTHPST
jgi:hypothetical protein